MKASGKMLCRRHLRLPALFASFTPTIARARQYGIFRAETVAALNAWFDEVGKGKCASTADLKQLSATAQRERIVFGIKGNDYRLVVSVYFAKGIVWIILRQSAGRLDREPGSASAKTHRPSGPCRRR
ncbi:type II toxin-antitoxin system HigB family toxin [Rhizobium sp. 3T7]|uniref:type II toxin-antitoxin system HigB family toxin n=1 Tax=Rhizobium sp. 3T7 TaxID=2874922 RepID=UPI001CCC2AD9|nr:type II toxin-antitoxin system HigB family toxin [Rhizobium sp. 3T7]MBZ9792042.1 type II toxin-antitoxin system HigB family toxin [Rhizobium sp. 3T7]